MSENKPTAPLLDIIVTHYDEPWEVGKGLFEMLDRQACVDFGDIRVIFVQADIAIQNGLPHNSLLENRPYRIDRVYSSCGVGNARNAGLDHATAGWVMFMDFDDCFADVCTLLCILQHLPTDDCDIIWSATLREQMWKGEKTYVNRADQADFGNTDGKLYRTSFLREHDITYEPEQIHSDYCGYIFNAVALSEADDTRILQLTTDFYPYLKTYRKDGLHSRHTSPRQIAALRYNRDITTAKRMKERGHDFLYARYAAKVICDAYKVLCDPDDTSRNADVTDAVRRYFAKHRELILGLPDADMEAVLDESETESMSIVQKRYNESGQELYLENADTPFHEWVRDMLQASDDPEPDQKNGPDLQAGTGNDDRVVVYCGTYNTYVNMLASAKSLLCNTAVDRIYFLTEDDKFPYELPDIIRNVNVKRLDELSLLDPEGPNFKNSWTYMCMIRAAFPQIFRDEAKILSLDIDVVVQTDISALWDVDLTGMYLAGVAEPVRQKQSADPLYVNFGVVMMNLDQMRKDGIQDAVISDLNRVKLGCPEQDAYNRRCAGRIVELPPDYNYTPYTHITGDAKQQRIVHYAGLKFWRHFPSVRQYANMDWSEVMERQNALQNNRNHKNTGGD